MFRPLKRTEGSVTASFKYSSACIVCREHDSASSPNPGHQVSDRYHMHVVVSTRSDTLLSLSSLRPPQTGFHRGIKKTPNPMRTVSGCDHICVARLHPPDITVVLPFIRMMKNQKPITRTKPVRTTSFPLNGFDALEEELLPYKGMSPSRSFSQSFILHS